MPASPPPTSVRALLEQAVAHHRAGRLTEAEQLYRQVLKNTPLEPDANHNLGLIALANGRRDDALPLFQAALAANPMQPQFLASFAGTLLAMGRDDDAYAVLQQGLERGARHPDLEALLQRAGSARGTKRPQHDDEIALFKLFQLGLHSDVQQEARRLLAQFPDSGFLWKILGASLQVQGKEVPETLEALRKAAALLPHEADAQNNLAVALRQRGEFAEAAQYSRRALQVAPQFGEALRNLGSALYGLRDYAGAAANFRQALALKATADTRINLGLSLRELGHHEDALAQLREAAHMEPDKAVVHNHIGATLAALGRPDEAIPAYRRAIELDPHAATVLNNLGNLLHDRRQIDEALSYYRRALQAQPDYADAHNNLGVALRELGRRDEAVASFHAALACRPDFVEAHSNLGSLLQEMNRIEEAVAHCLKAVEINPQFAAAHSNLGHVLHAARRYGEALESFRRALDLTPGFADAHSNLGALYRDMGQLDLAVQSCMAALQSDPDHLDAHSGLLFSCNYLAHESGAALVGHARRYGAAAARRARRATTWANLPDPARRLRIGFVSADLHRHPVGYFLDSVIAALHARHGTSLELHAYANNPKRDELTERLQAHCAGWRTVLGMSDEKLARQIQEDRIDILIDLSGHTTGTRLSMFAWKPAPVQASWLGYFATTGLDAMDYLVADPWTLPSREEAHFSERIRRLPETRLCFSAPDADIPVGTLPALTNGYVTFGCCNNLSKLGGTVLALWARILHAQPDSRLLLKNKQFSDTATQEDMVRRFAAHGIGRERLILEGPASRHDYLRTHRNIDIALDPFPYTGGTTTAEALWMGVPVLTLAGERFIARQGVGLLANAGLAGWIAADAEDYLAKAMAFAGDLPALAHLREGLREQVLASPLFDAERFAGHFEAMLRGMWNTWCSRQTKPVSQTR